MTSNPTSPRLLQLYQRDDASLKQELATGLLATSASLHPKFLYDALGSRLFDAITELPEYYPTRTEAAIFLRHAAEMAQVLGTGHTLVDLGAGSCAKAGRLFSVLKPRRYVAVDISVDYLGHALNALQREHPAIEMLGVGMDFSARLSLPPEAGQDRKLMFYPGSSIGNFSPAQALTFLREVREASGGGGLLIGVDLCKDESQLVAAYDDELGVTAAFNLNLLNHVNALLGTDFSVRDWRHVGLYNTVESRIEMHLEARHALTVRWPGGERRFLGGERIHTENSYKYRPGDFEDRLRQAGFDGVTTWTDSRGWFAVFAALDLRSRSS